MRSWTWRRSITFARSSRRKTGCRPGRCGQLRAELAGAGADLREGEPLIESWRNYAQMYEPFVNALSHFFILALPPVIPESVPVDNWQTSAWMRCTSGIGNLAPVDSTDDHVD